MLDLSLVGAKTPPALGQKHNEDSGPTGQVLADQLIQQNSLKLPPLSKNGFVLLMEINLTQNA